MNTSEADHGWHLFDAEKNLEVRRVGNHYEIRNETSPGGSLVMTEEEFDQLREEGANYDQP